MVGRRLYGSGCGSSCVVVFVGGGEFVGEFGAVVLCGGECVVVGEGLVVLGVGVVGFVGEVVDLGLDLGEGLV